MPLHTFSRTRSNRIAFFFILTILAISSINPSNGSSFEPHNVNESTPGWFPFVIPSLDASKTPIDLSWMNPEPAGARGRIRIKDGHFVDPDGKRIRFFGTNMTFDAALPPKDVAPKVAAHLRKLGINIVRFHHLDTSPSPRGILLKDRTTFDPEMLDRMDFFIDQLEQHGIYINLNLHVGRPYPGLPSDIPRTFRFGKVIDRFYPPFIEMQKEYVRALLTRRNPYTGLAYSEDPAVLTVEMNNENTMITKKWDELNSLPEPFRSSLLEQWREWLKRSYPTENALRSSWCKGVEPSGPELIKNGNFSRGIVEWTFLRKPPLEGKGRILLKGTPDGSNALAAISTTPGDISWAFQVYQQGLNLQDGKTYTFSFDAASPKESDLLIYASLDQEPWTKIGLERTIRIAPEWRHFEMTFTAKNTLQNHCCMVFNIGEKPREVRIANVSLKPGNRKAFDRISKMTFSDVDLVTGDSLPNQARDFVRFLIETELRTSQALRDYIREELRVLAFIVDTQVSYGGLGGLYREYTVSDQIDIHRYWQHPKFPGKPWDRENWHIGNTSMTADDRGGTLFYLARHRIEGRPFSVSEYNHASPNHHQSEMFPMYATFAAWQDWDAIYHFTYRNSGSEWDNRMITNYFNMDGNPNLLAFAPFAALTFRGDGFPSVERKTVMSIPPSLMNNPKSAQRMYLDRLWKDNTTTETSPLYSQIAVRFDDDTEGITFNMYESGADNKGNASPDGIYWNHKESIYRAVSEKAVALTGNIASEDKVHDLGVLRVRFDNTSNGYATFTAASMDDRPLSESGKILITIANRIENSTMGWNEDHTTVGKNWGKAPTIAEGIAARIELVNDHITHVAALDGCGAIDHAVDMLRLTKGETVPVSFSVSPEDKTLWYILD